MLKNILPNVAAPDSAVPVEPLAQCEFEPHLPFAVQSPVDSATTAKRPEVTTGEPRPGTSFKRTIFASTPRTDRSAGFQKLDPRSPSSLRCGCLGASARRADSEDGSDPYGASWNDPHCDAASATQPQRRSDG